MILLTIFIWAFAAYQVLQKQTGIKTGFLRGLLAFFFSLNIVSYSFVLSLFAHLPFSVYFIFITAVPVFFLWKFKEYLPAKISFKPIALSYVLLISVFAGMFFYTWKFFPQAGAWGVYGAWDAWAIWNLHARFLTYDAEFMNLFSQEIAWTHPDYPLFLPSIIAVLWKSLGTYAHIIPLIVGYVLSLSIVLFSFASLYEKGTHLLGVVLLLLLSCTGVVWYIGSSQYADTVVSLYVLLPFVALNHSNDETPLSVFLIGFFAASAAWVKNEGLVFFLIFAGLYLLHNRTKFNRIKYFLFGIALPLFVILIFKFVYAPANDLVEGQNGSTFQKISDASRYTAIVNFLLYKFNSSYVYYFVYALLFSALIRFKYHRTIAFQAILLLLLAYLSIYVVTPRDLQWHMTTTYDRLIHHVTPALLYSIFAAASNDKLVSKAEAFVKKIGV